MSDKVEITVRLPASAVRRIDRLVERGLYRSRSEAAELLLLSYIGQLFGRGAVA